MPVTIATCHRHLRVVGSSPNISSTMTLTLFFAGCGTCEVLESRQDVVPRAGTFGRHSGKQLKPAQQEQQQASQVAHTSTE